MCEKNSNYEYACEAAVVGLLRREMDGCVHAENLSSSGTVRPADLFVLAGTGHGIKTLMLCWACGLRLSSLPEGFLGPFTESLGLRLVSKNVLSGP
jgi:hypothetical protein